MTTGTGHQLDESRPGASGDREVPRHGRRGHGSTPDQAGQAPRHRRPAPRRLRRRRLLLASAPLVLLVAILAVRLVTLNTVHDRTLAAYEAGDRSGTLEWAGRQGWLNLVESFRAPFAEGDGHVLGSRFDLARESFEQALALVPRGGLDECKVRVNLGLTYERLGDDASARERPEEARQFYERGLRVTRERPPLCDAPERGEDTGSRLDGAQERMESKLEATDPGDEQEPGAEGASPPNEPVQPTPDPGQAPSEQQQEQLERQQRENTAERNRELGTEDREATGGEGGGYPKPW